MSLTKEARVNHRKYELVDASIRGEINTAFDHATAVLRAAGLNTSNTDPAEELVAAIMKYVLASNPALEARCTELGFRDQED